MVDSSRTLFERACTLIPGGVNSPVRAGKSVDIIPPFISAAEGCRIRDVEGNDYIDYVGSWGPMILGHRHPEVIKAIHKQLDLGTSYGASTDLEIAMAQLIVDFVPSIEMVRMVNSGTEAAMSAIRLARGFTGRDKVVKFDGCYHGHSDGLLVSAGSGLATLGIPGSPGVPADFAKHTLSLPYNDMDEVNTVFEAIGEDVAAVIVEPIAGNMGLVPPKTGFLEGLRDITLKHGSLLIFDEVISGFRAAPGGAQELYGVSPDITCLGKIIGGGLPVGAYGGSKKIMSRMAPEGDIYQAGTLSGNPLAMAAGIATLKILKTPGLYDELERKGARLFSGLKQAADSAGVAVSVNRVGSMGTMFFTSMPVTDFETAKAADQLVFGEFFRGMLARGVYLAPSAFETTFISTAHDDAAIEETIRKASEVISSLGGDGAAR
ncbi:MAG TPA: glutamate-1-semialdehyde-2,1-aminomutase [Desulfobacteraceae bacterium]|nr:glutamate-1-semialdehyde-2,1-aminomutase [Desulfobacteraceae bacterium]